MTEEHERNADSHDPISPGCCQGADRGGRQVGPISQSRLPTRGKTRT